MVQVMSDAVRFFYEHAGFSFDPATETEEFGRRKCAEELARAEEWLREGPYFVDHEPDDMPWDGDVPYDGPLWTVTVYGVQGGMLPTALASLSSVACEESDPYMRVVAAELASQVMANLAAPYCSQCGPRHLTPDDVCERHGKPVRGA